MANHAVVTFNLDFVADGVSTTLVLDLGIVPIKILYSGNQLSLIFNKAVSDAITGLTNLSINGFEGVAASISGGTATFTFTGTPPANGTRCTIQGNIQF